VLASVVLLGTAAACGGSGPSIQSQDISRALVSADGRTITVPALGGGCVTGVHLTAAETSAEVDLRLTARVSGEGVCPADVVLLQASVVLPRPLGSRRLVDQATGRAVPYIPGQDLARPGWLPPGAGKPGNSFSGGWTRTYTFPESRRLAPLEISENPGRFADPQQFADGGASPRKVSVGGKPARLVVEDSGHLGDVFVGWMAGKYSIVVSSAPWYADQRTLSPRAVLRVARTLRVPARAR